MPFPTTFPAESAMNLALYLRGGSTQPVLDTAEDVYDLLGYGMNLMRGTTPTLMLAVPTPSDSEAADTLQEMASVQGTAIGAMPAWLVPFLIGLAQRLLEEWQKA